MPTREEIAWAAGLFEGEGCVTESDRRFTFRLNNTDETVVRRFDDIVGWGRVWVASDHNAYDAFNMLASWLSRRRIDRARALTGIRFPVTFRSD